MTGVTSVPGPAGWERGNSSGAWVKRLPTDGPGDVFSALRLSPGGTATLAGAPDVRFLLLDGRVDLPERADTRHRGDWFALPADGSITMTSDDGAALVRVAGPRLGDPADDLFGPGGWQPWGPGQWFRLLLEVTFDEEFDERVVGLALMEPGSFAPRHPHPTAHRFLVVEGGMDDELLFPDGHRETARRHAGDFIDYPFPIEHQSFSRDGALILFLHEPLRGT